MWSDAGQCGAMRGNAGRCGAMVSSACRAMQCIVMHRAPTIVGAPLVGARIDMHCWATRAMIAMHGRCEAMAGNRVTMHSAAEQWGNEGIANNVGNASNGNSV